MVSWYMFMATDTLKQAINMTEQNEIIEKVNAFCSVPGKVLQEFSDTLLSCFTCTLGQEKHLPSTNQMNKPAQLDHLKAIRSSMKSSNVHSYTLPIALPISSKVIQVEVFKRDLFSKTFKD